MKSFTFICIIFIIVSNVVEFSLYKLHGSFLLVFSDTQSGRSVTGEPHAVRSGYSSAAGGSCIFH